MISAEKQILRVRMRDALRGMAPDEREAKSRRIAEELFRGLGESPGIVFGFAPMKFEPDWCAPEMAGWTIGLPRVDGETLEFHRVVDWEALAKGAYGNREPRAAEGTRMLRADVVLVPGLAFDSAGRRLGRGGGFYDRFLAGFAGRKIGVCFAAQLVDALPVEAHDAAVDAVVTENGWREARSSAGRPD